MSDAMNQAIAKWRAVPSEKRDALFAMLAEQSTAAKATIERMSTEIPAALNAGEPRRVRELVDEDREATADLRLAEALIALAHAAELGALIQGIQATTEEGGAR